MKRLIPLALALTLVGAAPVLAEGSSMNRSTTTTTNSMNRSDCSAMSDATARLNCDTMKRNEGYNAGNTSVTPSAGSAGVPAGSMQNSGAGMQQPGTAGTGPSARTNPGLSGDGGSGSGGQGSNN